MKSEDLVGLEEKIFYQYGRDGALETVLGIALLLIGLSKAVSTETAFPGLIPILVILAIRAWRKRITYPRLGYVEFSRERRTRTKRAVIILLFVAITTVALAVWGSNLIEGTSSADPAAVKNSTRLLFGGMLSIVIAAVARFRRLNHLYAFALLNFLFFAAVAWFHLSSGFAFAGTGLSLLIFGLIRVTGFLKAHPLQETPSNA